MRGGGGVNGYSGGNKLCVYMCVCPSSMCGLEYRTGYKRVSSCTHKELLGHSIDEEKQQKGRILYAIGTSW